ncbi:amino acid ABC transporter substrate-binding protein, partial [Mesorhizobium sp. M5C.F.Ca.ET.164.01.1.1]
AGKEEFAKALGLIKDGKPIRYEGVIGPVAFDQFGDITGPFRLWKIVDGKVTTDGEMTSDDVNALQAKLR